MVGELLGVFRERVVEKLMGFRERREMRVDFFGKLWGCFPTGGFLGRRF